MTDEVREEEGAQKAPKRRRRRIAVGVVAAILVVAGCGFWVWHEQPSFCAAVCHVPMDAYYDTYDFGDKDKYGNAVEDSARPAMMAYRHKTLADTTCMGCHVPTLSEQVSEGLHWVSGDYEVVGYNADDQWILETRSLDDLTAARGVEGDRFCLNEACHANPDGTAMTRDDLRALTEDSTRNPHVQQHREYACGDCHKAHEQSTNQCVTCHADAPMPEGWVTPAESRNAAVVSR